MFAKTVLDNGIRVISHEMPDQRSASVGIWVENGSRHESSSESGISHFIEHLLFKGTRRHTAAEIAEEMDAVGGVLNAFTAKEHTCYYAKVLDEDLPLAIDLLTDIFLNSNFDPEEIERERSVILQEISQAEDTPDDYVHDLFSIDFFKDHSLARPICGSAENVTTFTHEHFVNFFQSRYRPPRVIVSAAGHLKHDDLVREMAASLGNHAGDDQPLSSPFPPDIVPAMGKGVFTHEKKLEQVHLCLGMAGTNQSHPQRYAAYVLNTLLGGGMSSRLFQEIREKRGKAYSVYSFAAGYKDVGYFGVYAGTSVEWTTEVIDLIGRELKSLAAGKISQAEIQRTRGQLVGSMMLGLESTDSWMSHIARNEIYFGRSIGTEEICQGIRAVTRDEVVDLAQLLFRPETLTLSLLGDFNGSVAINQLL